MELSLTQKLLVHLLKESGAEETEIIAICLAFKDKEENMEDMILYIVDNHPTMDQISLKTAELLGIEI